MYISILADVLRCRSWEGFQKFDHPDLVELAEQLPQFLSKMRSSATINAYERAYARFERWAENYNELKSFPASDTAVGAYVIKLVKDEMSKSTIRQFLASVAWKHQLAGYPDPTDKNKVRAITQSAYRQRAKPTVHKEPVPKEILTKIHDFLFPEGSSENLHDIRDFVWILLSFVGFLRYDEISRIQRNHLHMYYDYMYIDIQSSKTDVTRRGNNIHIICKSSKLCTLTWLARYLLKAGVADDSDEFIFRAVFYSSQDKTWGLRHQNKVLAHSTMAEMLKKRVKQTGYEGKVLTLHGLRAGGVTRAANAGVPETLYKAHGRWASEAVGAYVQHKVHKKLIVTKQMNM